MILAGTIKVTGRRTGSWEFNPWSGLPKGSPPWSSRT